MQTHPGLPTCIFFAAHSCACVVLRGAAAAAAAAASQHSQVQDALGALIRMETPTLPRCKSCLTRSPIKAAPSTGSRKLLGKCVSLSAACVRPTGSPRLRCGLVCGSSWIFWTRDVERRSRLFPRSPSPTQNHLSLITGPPRLGPRLLLGLRRLMNIRTT